MNEFERDIRSELQDLKVGLARIEEKQNYFMALDHRLAVIENNHPHPDHETRIRALEKKVWLVAGGLAVATWVVDKLPIIFGN